MEGVGVSKDVETGRKRRSTQTTLTFRQCTPTHQPQATWKLS
jgi:hypothetical protein